MEFQNIDFNLFLFIPPENTRTQMFSIFKGYKMGTYARNGLIIESSTVQKSGQITSED